MFKMIKNQKGMTLVELLAVMVIVGIIAAISIPAIGNMLENTRKDAHISNAQALTDATRLMVTSNEAEIAAALAMQNVGTGGRSLTFEYKETGAGTTESPKVIEWVSPTGVTTADLDDYLENFIDPHTKKAYPGATVTVTDKDNNGQYIYTLSLKGAKATVGTPGAEVSAMNLNRALVLPIGQTAPKPE